MGVLKPKTHSRRVCKGLRAQKIINGIFIKNKS